MRTTTRILVALAAIMLFAACDSSMTSYDTSVTALAQNYDGSGQSADTVVTCAGNGRVTDKNGAKTTANFDLAMNSGNNWSDQFGKKHDDKGAHSGDYSGTCELSGAPDGWYLTSTEIRFTLGIEPVTVIVQMKTDAVDVTVDEPIDVPGTTASLTQDTTALDGAETTLETTWAAHQADPVTTTSQAVLDAFSPVASFTGSVTSAMLVAKDHRDRAVAGGADPLGDDIVASDLALGNAETKKLEAMTTMNVVLLGLNAEAATSGDQATLDAIAALSAQITALGDVATQEDLDALLVAIQAAIAAIPGSNPSDVWNVGETNLTIYSGVDGSHQTADIRRYNADGSTAQEWLGCTSPCRVDNLPVGQPNTLHIEVTGLQSVDLVDPAHVNAEPSYANITMWPPQQLGWVGALKVEVGMYLNLTAIGYEVCDYDVDNICQSIDQALVTFMGVSGDAGATSVFVLDQAYITAQSLTDADFMFGTGFAVGDLVLLGNSPGCTTWNASYNSENTDPDPRFRAYEIVGGNENPAVCP